MLPGMTGMTGMIGDADQHLRAERARAAQNAAGQIRKSSPMDEHAKSVHDVAVHLAALADRLDSALHRLTGPVPTEASKPPEHVEPVGVLLVAQFGVERCRQNAERLAQLIARLETLV